MRLAGKFTLLTLVVAGTFACDGETASRAIAPLPPILSAEPVDAGGDTPAEDAAAHK